MTSNICFFGAIFDNFTSLSLRQLLKLTIDKFRGGMSFRWNVNLLFWSKNSWFNLQQCCCVSEDDQIFDVKFSIWKITNRSGVKHAIFPFEMQGGWSIKLHEMKILTWAVAQMMQHLFWFISQRCPGLSLTFVAQHLHPQTFTANTSQLNPYLHMHDA